MDEDDLREQILSLEVQIEELAETVESCRKITLISKAIVAVGGTLILAMAIGMGISIWLFSNQTEYVGIVPKHVSSAGDLTFEAGFLITAAIYLGWHAIAGTGRETTLSPDQAAG